jgi:hypothetical protein
MEAADSPETISRHIPEVSIFMYTTARNSDLTMLFSSVIENA